MVTRRTAPLLLAFAVVACDRKPPAPPPPPPPVAVKPSPDRPLKFERKTPAAVVSMTLPAEVAAQPALYSKLYSDGRTDLTAFVEGAKGEAEDLASAGAPEGLLQRKLTYKLTAETPRLLGLVLEEYEDTRGAHPNAALSGLIWDKAAGKTLKPLDLVRPDADRLKLDTALCDAIHAAKQAKTGSPDLQADQRCPAFADIKITLAPGKAPGKAGGITALFSPYEIGPWVEGDYRLALPQAVISDQLAPAYAGEFEAR